MGEFQHDHLPIGMLITLNNPNPKGGLRVARAGCITVS